MSATIATREKHPGPLDHEPTRFRVMAWGVFCFSALVLCAGLLLDAHALPAAAWELFLWIGLVAGASLVPLTSTDGPALVMDLPVLLGAGFLHGALFAGLLGLLGCVDIREFRREISISRALLNRAQISLSAMAAATTFRALGAHLGVWPGAALAGLVAVAADCIVNYSLVAAATSMLTRRPVVGVLRDMHFGSAASFIPMYACFGFLGVLLGETYQRLGFAGVVGFVAPIVLARQGFVQWNRLSEARRSLATKTDALRRVDERIADERRDERARIAASLHDDVLQCLYNVTIRTDIIREDLRHGRLLDLDDDLPALLNASEQAVEELRDVIRDLRRSAIGHAGLVETLTLLLSHLEAESGISFVVDLDPTINADANRELLTYQVAREALTNALKHSGARTVWVSLRHAERGIELTIEDDGCGFDPSVDRGGRHFGVELMRERTAMAGGSVDIRSAPGAGTVVAARIPVPR